MTVAVDDDGLFCNRRRGLLRSRVLFFCALGPLGLRLAVAVSASLFRRDRNRPREDAHNGNDGEPLLPHTSLPNAPPRPFHPEPGTGPDELVPHFQSAATIAPPRSESDEDEKGPAGCRWTSYC